MSGVISLICLLIVGALCAVGIFHPLYKDTLGERVGLSLICIWCIARVPTKLAELDTEPVHLMLHVGLAVFASSMAVAKYRARHRIRRRCTDDKRTDAVAQ